MDLYHSLSKSQISHLYELAHRSMPITRKDALFAEEEATPLFLLQTFESIVYATYSSLLSLLEKEEKDIEFVFSPFLHTNQSLRLDQALKAVFEGIKAAKLEGEMEVRLIIDCLGDKESLELAKEYVGKGVASYKE